MNTFTRNIVGGAVAGAMALSSVTPALARGSHDGGIGAGEVIAGALIIGGIAAIASSSGNRDRGDYAYDRAGYRDGRDDYRDGRYSYGEGFGNPRGAVEKCVRAAERSASRYSRGNADVTDIRSVRDTGNGYRIRGRIAVNARGHDWRAGDRQYGDGWNGDYRGWNSGVRGYDSGTFDCRVSRGRVVALDFNGIRGL